MDTQRGMMRAADDLQSAEEKFMPPELVPTAGGPDVLPNPMPEPDP
jgi:hypothetical protein